MAVAATLVVAACSSSSGSGGGSKYKVGMFLMVSASVMDQIQTGFQQGFLEQTGWTKDKVSFETKNAQGDQSLIQSIAREFGTGNDDMIEVVGTPAVIAQAKVERKKPVIAVAMGDPVGSGVAKSLDHPGGNVTGSIDYVDPSQILDQILEVTPTPKTVGTIYNAANENSQVWVKALKAALAAKGLPGLKEATVTSSADVNAAARSLSGRADTVLIGPDADAIAGLPAIAKAAQSAKQELFLVGGDATVPGVLASIGPNYQTLGVEAGKVAGKVALGAAPGEVAFARPEKIEWVTNQQTATKLGVTLPAGVG
ncbi:MAG TPA: ABC transporter substrate-binding protein [Jatrophihabitantaceae bacterium]|jgi:putative ABC transport system substrate-binding protein